MDEIDLTCLEESVPSLCIPRVFISIDEQYVRKIFEKMCIGSFKRIDIVKYKNENGEFNRVYIHFDKWFWNDNAQTIRKKLLSGKELKIVYDMPWFWKVSVNKHSNKNKKLK
jgi:hypothetical protein